MPSKQKPQLSKPGATLGETATQFLSTISSDLKAEVHQEIFKFIRWYGEERQISSISGQEVANYSEQFYNSATQSPEHLNIVKRFLTYAYKQGFTSSNFGTHIRIKKIPTKASTGVAVKAEEPVILTSHGYQELKNKLASLKNERPMIAEELRRAAADKDFRENAPLEATREQQGHIEGQIRELEDTLKRAKLAEAGLGKGVKVSIGDTILLEDQGTGEKLDFTLVGSREANVKQGKISIISPMGQVLFNKEIGDTVNVNAPSGIISYKILDIKRN